LAHRTLAILNHGPRFHGEYLVRWKLLAIIGNQLPRSGIVFLRDQELQESRIERLLLRIARNPRTIVRDRYILGHPLCLNNAKDALERLPRTLLRYGCELLSRDRRRRRNRLQCADLVVRPDPSMVKIRQRKLSV